jgi:hypothetical protein
MEGDVEILNFDQPFFSAVQRIAEKEVVLVRGHDGKISGLVTATDISLQFRTLAEPFLLIGEIENHIRRLIHGRIPIEQLRKAIDSKDTDRVVNDVSDLTFGEYVRLLENPANWKAIELPLDRSVVVKRLEQVRKIRNDVMHFDPDGIADEDSEVLKDTVGFLQKVIPWAC